MLKLERAFRTFVIAARAAAAVFLFAGPASASTYTMQDYYNALAVVENDYWIISSLQADISNAQGNIQSANYYYQWQISQCVSGAGNANTGSNQPNWYAIQECQDGYYMEWYVVVTGFENDIAGAETGLWGMYPILSTDEAFLALIKADLGIE